MKRTNRYITGILALSLLQVFQSCKKEMVDLNTNPNIVESAPPEYQFTNATQDMDYSGQGQLENRYQFMVYMQYIVPDGTTANLQGNYWSDTTASSGPAPSVSYYSDYYSTGTVGSSGIGTYMHQIINQIDVMSASEQASYAYLKAICQVLDVYNAWRAVDIYGAMPYTQAFNASQYPLPAYDYDWTLYKTFDSTLKVAATTLESATIPASFDQQDLFFGGNAASWEATASTLRIKIAQRYALRDPANLSGILTDIQNNFGGQIISSNAESFGYNHTQTWNDNEDNINGLLLSYDAGYAFVAYLKSTHDPRLSLMVRQNDCGVNSTVYNSIISGGTPASLALLADSSAFANSRFWGKHAFQASQTAAYGWTGAAKFQAFGLSDGTTAQLGVLSSIQSRFLVKNGGLDGLNQTNIVAHTDESTDGLPNTPVVAPSSIQNRTLFLSYAETCFMMAEIAQEGGNGLGQTAAQWYNNGVQASFAQYQSDAIAAHVPGADTVTMGNLLNNVPYDGTLKRIYSQEWVHLMIEPEEAWALWKRTGYPQFASYVAGQPGTIGDGSGTAYLESLTNGSSTGVVPRRAAFTPTNSGDGLLNAANFNMALSTMESFNPAYGTNGNYAIGRVWWDTY